MISLDAAQDLILREAHLLQTESLPLIDALGRWLASPMMATMDMPRFDNSAVDGYAISQSDVELNRRSGPINLTCVGLQSAGDGTTRTVAPGSCVQVMTGARIPAGTAAVVMQEDVTRNESTVAIQSHVELGANIRRQGEECRIGELLLEPGSLVGPATVSLAASQGLESLTVCAKPRVSVAVTGTELRDPTQSLGSDGIFDSNGPALAALLARLGVPVMARARLADNSEEIRETLCTLLRSSDALLVSGGVSVGIFDLVKPILLELGVRECFWRVAVKPGKPVFFGMFESEDHRCAVFALPGNPFSALTTATLFAAPYLKAIQGCKNPLPTLTSLPLAEPVVHHAGRREFRPALLRAGKLGLAVSPLHRTGSHMLSGIASANAFIVLDEAVEAWQQGEVVPVILLSDTPLQ